MIIDNHTVSILNFIGFVVTAIIALIFITRSINCLGKEARRAKGYGIIGLVSITIAVLLVTGSFIVCIIPLPIIIRSVISLSQD